jgi:hypothetical protein
MAKYFLVYDLINNIKMKKQFLRKSILLLILGTITIMSFGQASVVCTGGTNQTFLSDKSVLVKYNPSLFGGNTQLRTLININGPINAYDITVTNVLPGGTDPPIGSSFPDLVFSGANRFSVNVTANPNSGTGTP